MLGYLGGGSFGRSSAFGVTPDGSVVVGQSISETSGGWQAFRCEASSMGALSQPPDSTFAVAHAISADGRVIAGSTGPPGTFGEAAMWEDGLRTDLGQLPGGAVDVSNAIAVSADGSLVVGNAYSARGPDVFLWSRDSGMTSSLDLLELSASISPAGPAGPSRTSRPMET